ncbi:MAG: methylenetetrahydrofolate reductase [NAD(P)H] [Gammaproteobacteria bacterium]|nr:methylenetetrahydrofolate reductase [NAD(P)H] [Gammaproteobacteria bacterium]
MKSQQAFEKCYSFEFFPPKTEQGKEKLLATHDALAKLKPRFFSVTFGAGGSTRDRTLDSVLSITRRGSEAAPHISCVASSKKEIDELLRVYQEKNIRHLVALRGDMPSGAYEGGEFNHANELVSYIRQQTGDIFFIEVAAYPEFHPQSNSPAKDIAYFVNKIKAGANSAITQYFYNPDAYFHFVDQCEANGINVPIVPGIMPINNYEKLARFSDACGAEIPRWIRKKLESYEDDLDSLRAFGIDVVTHLCDQLLTAGAPGLHFYTMNMTEPTRTIWKNLKLPR